MRHDTFKCYGTYLKKRICAIKLILIHLTLYDLRSHQCCDQIIPVDIDNDKVDDFDGRFWRDGEGGCG